MPNNSGYLSGMRGEDRAAEVTETKQDLISELGEVDQKLRIYNTEAWAHLREKLKTDELAAVNEMLMCDPSELLAKREKARTLRNLGAEERELRRDRARIIAGLEAIEEGE